MAIERTRDDRFTAVRDRPTTKVAADGMVVQAACGEPVSRAFPGSAGKKHGRHADSGHAGSFDPVQSAAKLGFANRIP